MAEPLTVLTWLWSQPGGRAQYTALHVNIWADMVRRHLSMPHRLACVTDLPDGIDPDIAIIAPPRDFEDVRIPTWPAEKPQCLRRIALFRKDAAQIFGAARLVSMDMDCVVAGPLDPLFDTDAEFKMYRGTAPGRPYNGSMLLLTAGARCRVYDEFTPERAVSAGRRYVGSDQAWISQVLGPHEAAWDEHDGVVWWQSQRKSEAAKPRLMFFPGWPKPWDVIHHDMDSWVTEHYRRDPQQGRCLILGYGESLWEDVGVAIGHGPVAAVIASLEAAAHWPGPIDEIAQSDRQALRLARMRGFEDVTFCGRTEQAAAA